MRSLLKKVAIGTIFFMLCVAIFWNTLTATALWGLALYQTRDLPATRTLPEQAITLDHTAGSNASSSYGTISIPHIFNETEVIQQSDTVTVFKESNSNIYYVATPITPFAETLVTNNERTTTETAVVCEELTAALSQNPCANNQSFIEAIMNVSNKSASLISPHRTKEAIATAVTLKGVYLPPGTQSLTPFSTPSTQGYIASEPERSVAYAFTQTGQGYELLFVKMTPEQIHQVLSDIRLGTIAAQ